jgi:hypothetical protein
MTRTRHFLAALIAGSVAVYSAQAAALDSNLLSGLEARGLVDSFGSGTPVSSLVDAETTPSPDRS